MEKAISVIVPVYNSEKYLKKTIDSILNQTFENFELILINDGSTDHSGEICDEIAQKDKRIKVIHKKNEGICKTRNKGIEVAKGEYIMFADNDDIIEKNMLQECYEMIKENDADMLKFGRKTLYLNDENILKTDVKNYEFQIMDENKIKNNVLNLIYDKILVCVWDGIYKRNIIPFFDTEFKKGGEDIDFNYKVINKIKKLVISDKVYYNHYIRDGFSTSTKYNEERIDNTIKLLDEFKSLCYNKNCLENEKYNLIQIRDFFNAIIIQFNSKQFEKKYREKKEILKNIKFDFKKCNFIKIMKISKKYTFEYILLKLKMYRFLFILPKLKNMRS